MINYKLRLQYAQNKEEIILQQGQYYAQLSPSMKAHHLQDYQKKYLTKSKAALNFARQLCRRQIKLALKPQHHVISVHVWA